MAQQDIQISVPIIGVGSSPVAYADQILDEGTNMTLDEVAKKSVAYGPYASVAAAHTALSDVGLNTVGTTVGISGSNNTVVEYWYQGGTAQANLVEKSSGGGGTEQIQSDWNQTDSTKKDFIKNKPTIPDTSDYYTKSQSDARYQPKGNYQPAGDYATKTELNGKVDKIAGKGLSTNDYTNEEKQKVANALVPADIAGKANASDVYTKSETYTKTEVNGLVDTPHEEYVTVDAYSNLPETGSKDTIYRVSNYNGSTSQVDASVYSQYAWNGSQYIFLCVKSQIGEVFDISVYNNNAKYADLSAALNGGANIPQSLQKGGMSVKFVQSSDNKYVQYRLIADSWSINTNDWAIADEGVYVENPEFVYVKTDNKDKILWAIKADGGIYYGAGVPQQVIDYIQHKIDELSLDEYEDIVAFLNGLEEGENTLQQLLDEKLDAEGLEPEALSTMDSIENPEWVDVKTDSEDKILEGINANGTKVIDIPVEIQGVRKETVNNPEFIQVTTDDEGKIIEAIRKDGKKVFYGGVEGAASEAYVNEKVEQKVSKPDSATNNNIVLFGNDGTIKDSGYNINNLPSGEDAVKSISINGNALPKALGNVNLPNASSENSGLMSPQDKMALGSLQPNINITGSGVTKNAASFNFLPTNSATDNNSAIANALNGGGTVLIDLPGIYDISEPIVLSSNTTLVFGANTFVRMNANKYALINAGAYTRVYDENIKLIGFHLISNGYTPPIYNVWDSTANNGIIYGLAGYVDFFYVKNLHVYNYVILDQQTVGYGMNICTFENVLVEKVHIKGHKDGLHFGRGKRLTVKDCIFQCFDDACTLNAVDFSRSQPEVGWIEDVLVDNCYDLPHEGHSSAGFFSRFMGGAWTDWESGMEVMLGSTVIVEENGFKRMYRVGGGQEERAYKFISTTKPTNTTVGTIELLDEQEVTRTIGGVTETKTMKIPWVLQQTQDVGYDGGVKNATLRNIHLQKTRTFTIQYYMDNEWLNAIVPNAQGTSIIENITFENVTQEYNGVLSNYPRFLDINCPVRNIRILGCFIKHSVVVNTNKIGNIESLDYGEDTIVLGNNTYAHPTNVYLASFGTGENHIDNRIRIYGSLLANSNANVQSDGATFITEDIV